MVFCWLKNVGWARLLLQKTRRRPRAYIFHFVIHYDWMFIWPLAYRKQNTVLKRLITKAKLGLWPVLWTDCLLLLKIFTIDQVCMTYNIWDLGRDGMVDIRTKTPQDHHWTASPKSSKQPQTAKYFLLLSWFILLGYWLKIFKAKIGLPHRFLERFVLPLGISGGVLPRWPQIAGDTLLSPSDLSAILSVCLVEFRKINLHSWCS